MKQFLKDFEAFAVRGNAIDLAIGVVIGAAFTGVVNALANNVITPVLGVYTGGTDFAKLALHLPSGASIGYGTLIQAVVNFVLIALILFLFVRVLGALAKKKKKQEAENPQLTVLKEIRDELKNK